MTQSNDFLDMVAYGIGSHDEKKPLATATATASQEPDTYVDGEVLESLAETYIRILNVFHLQLWWKPGENHQRVMKGGDYLGMLLSKMSPREAHCVLCEQIESALNVVRYMDPEERCKGGKNCKCHFIYDEASKIPPEVFEACEKILRGEPQEGGLVPKEMLPLNLSGDNSEVKT